MDELLSITPVNFYQIQWDCKKLDGHLNDIKKYRIPDLSKLCDDEKFADVAMGWRSEGIEVLVKVHHPYHLARHPEVSRGDSVEIFIDTRDVKTSGFNTRYCHHFFFLPKPVDDIVAGEMTRFRTEDSHDLCDPGELILNTKMKSNGYDMHIFIPRECLIGYDSDQFDRLGFTYRINRYGGDSQHFSVVTEDYVIEQQPSLWSSVRLVK